MAKIEEKTFAFDQAIIEKKRFASDIDCQAANDGMTEQNHAQECDINFIVKKLENTGLLNHLNGRPAYYADVSKVPDYQKAFDIVQKANDAFMSLDAFVRERFSNNPQNMVEFLKDPNNREEAWKLGLIEKPQEPVAPVGSEAPTK